MNHARYLLALAVVLVGCPKPAPVLDVHHYCDLPGATCAPCVGDACDGAAELAWCCDYAGGACSLAELLSDCDPVSQYAIWCQWGQSVPQSFPNGTSGFECFG